MRAAYRLLLAGGLLAIASACQTPTGAPSNLPAGVNFVSAVEQDPNAEVSLPLRKFTLDNGLTVVLHEDRSDPLVHVDVTYHVGSGREEAGKSGFAHFFEHMMFQGSENVADEQHFKIVNESGGTLNGTTNTDRTNYFQTVPANQLEKVLWLEADRMGFFLDAVTQEKFEVQRATVKNERAQNVDNRPYGRLWERVGEAMYPEGHPYSWSTIGYVEDLDRVNVNDLKKFFLRWYGPNNAVLTIGGDFNEAEVLAWVQRYFGPIPRGPRVDMPVKPPVMLTETRYISMEDNVALPLLYMGFPTVHLYHPDEAPLDVLMFILGVGETSLLYKNMVKNQIAVQAQTGHGCQELSCTFTVIALPNPAAGKTLADLEQIARDSLVEFESRGVTDDDVERVKMNIVSGMIYGLESVSGKVSRLAMYETYTKNANYVSDDIARYENVTKDDVMRVYRKYILGKPSVVMSVVPPGAGSLIAKPDTWQRFERELPEQSVTVDDDLAYRRANDTIDRSQMPPAGPNPSITLPAIWRGTTDNGIPVLGARNDEVPTTTLQLRIEAGQRHEPLDKLGLASLTAAMLNESTLKSTNEELSDRLQKLGSSVSFGAGNGETTLTVRALTRNLDEALAIAAERLLEPKFDPSDFARAKSQTLQAIEHSKKQAANTAQVVYQLLLMGRENPVAYLNMGTAETVSALTLDDVKAFYRERYTPRIANIIAVSNLEPDDLLGRLDAFSGWSGGTAPAVDLESFPETAATTVYLVDKPGAASSEIMLGRRALNYDATGEFYRARLANYALGAAFNSRINLNLREDKGYSYGARSFFQGQKDYGFFSAGAAVRTNATAQSIAEFEKEIRNYVANGITAEELSFTRSAIGQRDARDFETPSQKLSFLSRIQRYDLPDDFIDQQNAILASVPATELNAIARRHMLMDEMVIIVVGDRAQIESDLEGLGYPVVHLDEDGNPVGG
ncbi:MAG: peptidase M16 [Gammaproteobacteria bacterium]|nr:peptidase M16 [Gammaproteobacteria bacterium]